MNTRRFLIALLPALIAAPVAVCAAPTDEAAIRAVLMAEFSKPDAPLKVQPIVVAADHGIADWFQGSRGGRALMRRHGALWSIVLCSGDGLKDVNALQMAGIAAGQAAQLLKSLERAEAGLTPQQRGQLASFEGTVRMDAHGQHPPGHKH
ncbi:conserved exported hypothetical protein [Rubrivivax sp. A210]|uniref:copper uptake system-associated protein n=1 Tax=Rubrivivax sp. A210 TaxID=2772301 RepID=UPI001919C7FC|nr:copper uptake system-associated protein [Rubrivivax sp. A210]CAD5371850.1 conserved exported hypothetical protein [Rubrivivax sp. A210]